MMASTSSVWPLPSTPAMPRTSPLWMVKVIQASTSRTTPSGSVAASRRPSTGEHRDVGDRRLAGLGRGQFAADHQLGELPGGGGRRVGGADRRAAADDGDLVGDRQHLAQLVRDEDDGEALGLELAQVVEERVDLLRDQDGGGLVQDEGAGAAVEDLEDLHALAVGDAEVLDEASGRTPRPYASEISLIFARALEPMPYSFSAPRTTFSSTVRLSASMKCWCTMPMPRAMASPGCRR